MNESFVPIIRFRLMMARNIGLEVSYSYDYTNKLRYANAGSTNEIGLNYFVKSKPRVCPAQGKWGNNKKWRDVMNNTGNIIASIRKVVQTGNKTIKILFLTLKKL